MIKTHPSFYKYLFILIPFCFFQCKKSEQYKPIIIKVSKPFVIQDSLIDKTTWQNKDILDDSIPGISLIKAYNTILKNKKSDEVIVAVIDQVVDINHKDLKQNIWINTNEIPNNNIDDDENGYIDDINGWDFLGNKDGVDNKYMHTMIT
ncbi:S8 family serine peptidase [Lacinutrix sp.]|uniref:S8 family serine peptidase n=1 Tax=Lacinutrix sp. TaxID=1937692 RepID=UPI0025B7E239|nr:S8 family serine peptidase [Lacinutrix sp.]